MSARRDDRSVYRQMTDAVQVWVYVGGLSTMLIVWALIAFATIGSGTRHHPNYNLEDPTPASQTYNRLSTDFHRLRR